MSKIIFTIPIIAAFLLFMGVPAQVNLASEEDRPLLSSKKILVVYFSHSGNTREIANQIHNIAGGDIFEIQSVKPYPKDYDAVVKQARQELDSGYKPELKTKVDNIKLYDVIFIGYPNWWSTIPAPVKTFLSEYDLSGKIVAPFCTHGGGGLGRSVTDISKLCPESILLDSFAIIGSKAGTAQNEVSEWLRKIKITNAQGERR